VASADEPRQAAAPTIRVLVLNQAHLRPEMLRAVEDDAEAIFLAAGVQVQWLDQGSVGQNPFDLTVKMASGLTPAMVPNTSVGDLTLGFAAVDRAGEGVRGRLVWVFCDQVATRAAHHHLPISRLTGLVMAHEIGHLLLPAGHSESGLMGATWPLREGLLQYFDEPQAREIRQRLAVSQLR
jgi:hypothetical protein